VLAKGNESIKAVPCHFIKQVFVYGIKEDIVLFPDACRNACIDQLLNVDGTGFTHCELQEAYRVYTKGKTKPANPREWALGKTRNPEAIKLLKGFLGSDYIRRAKYNLRQPKQFINNSCYAQLTLTSHIF